MNLIDAGTSALGQWVRALLPDGALASLIVDGVIAGVGGVIVFLPQIMILFAFIIFLEDSGYMPRVAFMIDRLMRAVGLSGQSFIPMLSSFACAVPGVMATRVIPDRRDRLATMLAAPFMTCSARLPVYALLIGAFVPVRHYLGGTGEPARPRAARPLPAGNRRGRADGPVDEAHACYAARRRPS